MLTFPVKICKMNRPRPWILRSLMRPAREHSSHQSLRLPTTSCSPTNALLPCTLMIIKTTEHEPLPDNPLWCSHQVQTLTNKIKGLILLCKRWSFGIFVNMLLTWDVITKQNENWAWSQVNMLQVKIEFRFLTRVDSQFPLASSSYSWIIRV